MSIDIRTIPAELHLFPLYGYFLTGYLSCKQDTTNFPPDEFPDLFQRYENIFADALKTLGIERETLKARSEFNFDSGDAANLEGGIAILRVVTALYDLGFAKISLVTPKKGASGADIICEKNGHKICCEVKAITKQSRGRQGHYLANQLYEKIMESISKAKTQLDATARELQCSVKIFVCVINWLGHSVCLGQNDFQNITNLLEENNGQRSLEGIDGVLFVNKMGQKFLFLNEHYQHIGI